MARNTNQNFSQDRLRKYYKKEGISALNFNCKFYENCRSNCENKRKFVKAREPYIGPKYGKKKIPRLLFLSLDPGWSPILSKKRTIQYMRKSHLAFHRSEIPKGRHWYVTHQFTWIILDEFSKNSDSKLDIGLTNKLIHFDPKREIHKIMPYFAHTNSAKCCENNENSKLANKSMFKNCRAFIPGEVKIFDPHILVTQGQYAQRAIEEAINKGSFTVKRKRNISKASMQKPDFMVVEINENKPALWIHHYHPSNYGTFKKNRDKFRTYAKEAAKFLKTNYTEIH